MSERLNIAFCNESAGAPYVLLAVRDETLETPSMALWLGVLADIISEYAMNDDPRVSTLAAQIVAALVSSQAGADLLPGDSPWLADLTVTVSGIEGGFIISCKKRDLSALGLQLDDDELEPLDALDGFQGSPQEFKALVAGVQWDPPD
jgi:hypothetical protein